MSQLKHHSCSLLWMGHLDTEGKVCIWSMDKKMLEALGTQDTKQTQGQELSSDSSEPFSHGPKLQFLPNLGNILCCCSLNILEGGRISLLILWGSGSGE